MGARTRASAVVVSAAMLIGLTGCGQEANGALTLAFTASGNEAAPSSQMSSAQLKEHAIAALFPEEGAITVVTPSTLDVVDLTPIKGERVDANVQSRDEVIAGKLADLDAVLAEVTSATELDVIGTLDKALAATAEGGTVLLQTSGFSTVDPLNLNDAGGWLSDPAELVSLTGEADLPKANGKHIVFLGLGYPVTPGAQEPAGPAARTALETLYLGLCEKMGAISCESAPGQQAAAEAAPFAIPGATTPPIALDQLATACVGEVTIDTTAAFGPSSSELNTAIDLQLTEVVASMSDCAGSRIDAVGYSAIVPGEAAGSGSDLETQRAQAVLSRLVELGIPTAQMGTASAGGQRVDNVPGGVFNEELAGQNRVVVLTVGSSS